MAFAVLSHGLATASIVRQISNATAPLDLHKFLHFVLEPVLVLATEDLFSPFHLCLFYFLTCVRSVAESIAKDLTLPLQ